MKSKIEYLRGIGIDKVMSESHLREGWLIRIYTFLSEPLCEFCVHPWGEEEFRKIEDTEHIPWFLENKKRYYDYLVFSDYFEKMYAEYVSKETKAHLKWWRHNNTKLRYKRRESRLARRKR